jgi:hypothetical protein
MGLGLYRDTVTPFFDWTALKVCDPRAAKHKRSQLFFISFSPYSRVKALIFFFARAQDKVSSSRSEDAFLFGAPIEDPCCKNEILRKSSLGGHV